jgi:hypothetical protein
MAGRRKELFKGWMPGLYRKVGKRKTLYFTLPYTTLGNDLAAARRQLLELQEKTPSAGTITELLEDFLAFRRVKSKRDGKPSARTIADNEVEAAMLKKVFGHMRVTDLRMHHAWTYIHEKRTAKVRANREISFLSSAMSYAANRGDIPVNPLIGVEKAEEKPRDRLVTHRELASFTAFAKVNKHQSADSTKRKSPTGRRIALAAWLAYLTAKAEGQIIGLYRADIDKDGIVFNARKGGHAVLVEWTPKLRRVINKLLELEPKTDIGPLICTESGGGYSADGFRSTWQRIMRAWVTARPGRERFTFHDLRAKAVTKMKEQGRQASELTGHTSEAMPNKVYDRRRIRRAAAVE